MWEVLPITKNVVPRALVTLLTSAVLKLKEKRRRGRCGVRSPVCLRKRHGIGHVWCPVG